LAARAQPAEAAQLRTEAEAARARVAALAPDSWIVQLERAYALFAEGKHAEGIAVAKAMMESSPRSWEHTFPYTNLIFAVGRLEETFRISDELQAMEPLAMFMSRDQQWIHTSLRRYEDAEAEYQHSRTLAGSRFGRNTFASFACCRARIRIRRRCMTSFDGCATVLRGNTLLTSRNSSPSWAIAPACWRSSGGSSRPSHQWG
jgi:tetratricopeptide (TPR) repeat protein